MHWFGVCKVDIFFLEWSPEKKRVSIFKPHFLIQITVLVNDRKKTWKAFLNGQRIQHVNVSENESIPDYLSIADFDSLLEHLVLISPDTLMTNYEGGLEKKNDGNRHLCFGGFELYGQKLSDNLCLTELLFKTPFSQ